MQSAATTSTEPAAPPEAGSSSSAVDGGPSTDGQSPGDGVKLELVPEAERWFKTGDVILGKVLWSNNRGARIELVADPRFTGCACLHDIISRRLQID